MLTLVLGSVLGSRVAAQEGPTEAPDLPRLATLVEQAHRPDGPTDPVSAFDALLSIEPLSMAADEAGQVDLEVRYLRAQPDPAKRARHYIRYEVKGTDRQIIGSWWGL